MDFQNRPGGKTGTGGMATKQDIEASKRERQRRLALETIDLSKDPFILRYFVLFSEKFTRKNSIQLGHYTQHFSSCFIGIPFDMTHFSPNF